MLNRIYYLIFLAYNVWSYELEGLFSSVKSSLVTNVSTSIGNSVILNCSLNNPDYFKIRSPKSTTNFFRMNPTWIKADASYDQNGIFKSYQAEKIIVTRKGIIPENYRNKMKLISNSNSDQFLKISNVDISDEGKYICRELSTQIDQVFYVFVQCNFKKILNFNKILKNNFFFQLRSKSLV